MIKDVYEFVKEERFEDARKEIEKATGVKLYRFFGNTDHFLSALFGERIYISNAKDFNDPYDCLAIDENISTIINEDASLEEIYESKVIPLEKARIIQKGFSAVCFTRDYRNTVMWSHYANSHQGYCLEYRVEDLSKQCRDLLPVRYRSKRAKIDTSKLSERELLNCALTKHSSWSYEQEWRMIFLNEKNRKFVEKVRPSAVILGVNCDACSDKRLLELCSYCQSKEIGLYLAATCDDKYGIQRIKLV